MWSFQITEPAYVCFAGGVGSCAPGPQQGGHRVFVSGRAVGDERNERVTAEGFLPSLGGVLLLGVGEDQYSSTPTVTLPSAAGLPSPASSRTGVRTSARAARIGVSAFGPAAARRSTRRETVGLDATGPNTGARRSANFMLTPDTTLGVDWELAPFGTPSRSAVTVAHACLFGEASKVEAPAEQDGPLSLPEEGRSPT